MNGYQYSQFSVMISDALRIRKIVILEMVFVNSSVVFEYKNIQHIYTIYNTPVQNDYSNKFNKPSSSSFDTQTGVSERLSINMKSERTHP